MFTFTKAHLSPLTCRTLAYLPGRPVAAVRKRAWRTAITASVGRGAGKGRGHSYAWMRLQRGSHTASPTRPRCVQQGFSLVEVSIVTAIILIVSIIGIPAINAYVIENKV